MASTAPLQLFPSTHTMQPRKSSLKKSKPTNVSKVPGELKGAAVLVKSAPNSPALFLQPANDHLKHSLFCEPSPADQVDSNQSGPRRHQRTRRRSSGVGSFASNNPFRGSEREQPTEDDELSELPLNTHFGPGALSKGQLKRPKIPRNISTEAEPDTDTLMSPGGDTVSPLPTKTQFPTSPRRSEYPAPQSVCPQSPALVRSSSSASAAPPYSPGHFTQPKSIFPQYDHSRPLQEQSYYPTTRSPTPTLPSEKVSKLGPAIEKRPTLERLDSAVALLDGYEHIPSATTDDLIAIWNASRGNFPVPGRKVQLGLLQPCRSVTALAVGSSEDELLYSMEKEPLSKSSKTSKKQLVVQKFDPQQNASPASPVAQLALPDPGRSDKEREDDVVTIFPQMAAIKAIEAVANSPIAASIATFDPTAKSPEAARLAQDAMAEAQCVHKCELVRNTRKRDSLGAVTASYNLQHPYLGPFAITVTKSTAGGRHSRDPRAKISVHHPSATPAAVAAETLVLAYLDFARDACVLDIPGLLALESTYIIDTVICALLTVAAIENDVLMVETLTFDAPPKSPLPLSKQKARKDSRRNSTTNVSKRSSLWSKKEKKTNNEFRGEQVEGLPVLTQGALAILGLSFKAAVWVLGAGVKMTAGAVIGISHLASKA